MINKLLNIHTIDTLHLRQEQFNTLSNEEMYEKNLQVLDILRKYFKISGSRFSGKTFVTQSDCRFVYIRVSSRSIEIQFKGLFFLHYPFKGFDVVKSIFREIYFHLHQCPLAQSRINRAMEIECPVDRFIKLKEILEGIQNQIRVTQIHVKRDYLGREFYDVFPLRGDDKGYIKGDDNLYWSFKCLTLPYLDRDGKISGVVHILNNHEIQIYDKIKDTELKDKLFKKKKFYEVYGLSKEDTLTRVELKFLGGEQCNRITADLQNYCFGEIKTTGDSINELLQHFYLRNRVRVISKKDKNKSRWKTEERYKEFFKISNINISKIKCPVKGKYSVEINDRALNMYANSIVNKLLLDGDDLKKFDDELAIHAEKLISVLKSTARKAQKNLDGLSYTNEAIKGEEQNGSECDEAS